MEETSNFIKTIMKDDLENGKVNKIITRFPPEPNAYLHIGHARAMVTNFELANNVNGVALANIAKAANEVDATLLQISTDYVFDGKLDVNKEYTEDMQTNPVSAYGKSKLLGEQNAAKANKYYILRTAWLYGLGGKNFVKTMLKLSETNITS